MKVVVTGAGDKPPVFVVNDRMHGDKIRSVSDLSVWSKVTDESVTIHGYRHQGALEDFDNRDLTSSFDDALSPMSSVVWNRQNRRVQVDVIDKYIGAIKNYSVGSPLQSIFGKRHATKVYSVHEWREEIDASPQPTNHSAGKASTGSIRIVAGLLSKFSAFTIADTQEIVSAIGEALQTASSSEALPDAFIDWEMPGIRQSELVKMTVEAVERRLRFQRELLQSSVGLDEAAAILRTSSAAVEHLASEGQLIKLQNDAGQAYFPTWQFDRDAAKLLTGLPEVLTHLIGLSALEQASWLCSPNVYLEGDSPLSDLSSGNIDDVVALARSSRRARP